MRLLEKITQWIMSAAILVLCIMIIAMFVHGIWAGIAGKDYRSLKDMTKTQDRLAVKITAIENILLKYGEARYECQRQGNKETAKTLQSLSIWPGFRERIIPKRRSCRRITAEE